MSLESKLPDVGLTIFSVMSKLALEHGAINLAQGFPDFSADTHLLDAVSKAMLEGHNQYAPMPGHPELNVLIAKKLYMDYGWMPDPETEITITAGGTQAIYSIIGTVIKEGEEVIIIEPSYDCYIPSVVSFGGVIRTYQLQPPDYKVNWDQVEALVNDRTKLIIINTPHNPCGVLLEDPDLKRLEDIVIRHKLFVISDEVYEHIIFDGHIHQSVLRYPELYKRSFVVFSFGKSLHVTGWKTGYVVAPPALTIELRKNHQYNVFSVNRPMQHGIASYMQHHADFHALAAFYQQKRDFWLELVKDLPLNFLPCLGSYFIIADYSDVSDLDDLAFAKKLTIEAGVATIPMSPFYQKGSDAKILRFCFAKKEDTLIEAANRLKKYFGD